MASETSKEPLACTTLDEIRAEIDCLDEAIIRLIGKRFGYVKAAAIFKASAESVRAPERFQAMLRKRRTWAQEQGLDPDIIETLYRDLVNHFIDEEMTRWKASLTDA